MFQQICLHLNSYFLLNKIEFTRVRALRLMSVPRFTDEMLAPLKRVMLSCAPGFSLGPEHVQALAQETGLVKAQVQKWAENFRR